MENSYARKHIIKKKDDSHFGDKKTEETHKITHVGVLDSWPEEKFNLLVRHLVSYPIGNHLPVWQCYLARANLIRGGSPVITTRIDPASDDEEKLVDKFTRKFNNDPRTLELADTDKFYQLFQSIFTEKLKIEITQKIEKREKDPKPKVRKTGGGRAKFGRSKQSTKSK